MFQIIVVIVVAVVAIAVGVVASKQRPAAPAAPVHHEVPTQLDRDDFSRPDAPWLVAVFTSATCETCKKVLDAAALLDSDYVAVTNVEVSADAALHERYDVTAVPIVVMADRLGVVRGSFLGPPSAADLWAKLAEIREDQPDVS